MTLTTINCPRANNRVFSVNSPYHWWRKTAFLAILRGCDTCPTPLASTRCGSARKTKMTTCALRWSPHPTRCTLHASQSPATNIKIFTENEAFQNAWSKKNQKKSNSLSLAHRQLKLDFLGLYARYNAPKHPWLTAII